MYPMLLNALLLSGCATPSQIVADAEIKRLCAIDGGIKVYETVKLPPEKFNEWGQVNFFKPTQGENALGPEYIFKWEIEWFVSPKDPASHDFRMSRQYFSVIRSIDRKLLGETVIYGRGGGDIPGAWFPSGYGCPPISEAGNNAFLKRIFINSSK